MRCTHAALALLGLILTGLAGCQNTGSLGGTSWTVVEVIATDQTDIVDMDIDFGTDGWVTTTTTHADGEVETARRQYSVYEDAFIVVRRPEGDLHMVHAMDGGEMHLTATSFHARLTPLY